MQLSIVIKGQTFDFPNGAPILRPRINQLNQPAVPLIAALSFALFVKSSDRALVAITAFVLALLAAARLRVS